MAFRKYTAPFNAFESWFYDRFMAPSVTDIVMKHLEMSSSYEKSMPENAAILDAGCGGGQILIRLAKRHPGWKLTGLDLSPEQIRRAESRAKKLGGRVNFILGSVQNIPLPDSSFDGIYSVASIKHWPDPKKGLAECMRVLKPGGLFQIGEVDREFSRKDAEAFVAAWRIPAVFSPLALDKFSSMARSQTLSKKEALELFANLPITDLEAVNMQGAPAWIITGRKKTDG